MFDNHSDNQEFFLKQQERINRVTNGTIRVHIGENIQEIYQSKAYQQYLENTENIAEIMFTSLFTSNHEDTDTKIVYC